MEISSPSIEASVRSARPAGPLVLVRSLARRYLFVLIAVAVLVVVDQAIIQPQLVRLNVFAPAINVAGRQRMLSQKVTKESLALATRSGVEDTVARRQVLLVTIDLWTAAHHGLLEGNRTRALEPIEDAKITAALRELEPKLLAIRSAARQVATTDASRDNPVAETRVAVALETILAEEPGYLQGMDRVVGMLETSAGRQVSFLRWCGVAAMLAVLGLLVGVFFAVLRPATNLIREQIAQLADSESRHRLLAGLLGESHDELESRVARRTGELVEANRALEHEIAERKAAEIRMRELSTELAHASRVTALGQLATGLAHEINQPLASITNYADVLDLSLEDGTTEVTQTRSTIAQLKQAALRAGSIVRRMRSFVRPATGDGKLAELNDLVREVCDLCRPQFEQGDVRMTTVLTDAPTTVKAEALEIQQVLVNLVQNAAQALAGCPRHDRQINIRTFVAADGVHVEVADSGPGFSTPCAEDSFAPFFSTKPEGLGMGLSISRTILDRYQGRFWGQNRAVGGALVSFCLPLAAPHESHASPAIHCLCR